MSVPPEQLAREDAETISSKGSSGGNLAVGIVLMLFSLFFVGISTGINSFSGDFGPPPIFYLAFLAVPALFFVIGASNTVRWIIARVKGRQ